MFETVLTTCPYCGCGCGMYLPVQHGRLGRPIPDRSHPLSRGGLCIKGHCAHEHVASPDRLTTPLVRRNGRLADASWDEALGLVADRLRACAPERLAFLASAKCSNEENYLLQKVARAVFGTNSVDHCARL